MNFPPIHWSQVSCDICKSCECDHSHEPVQGSSFLWFHLVLDRLLDEMFNLSFLLFYILLVVFNSVEGKLQRDVVCYCSVYRSAGFLNSMSSVLT